MPSFPSGTDYTTCPRNRIELQLCGYMWLQTLACRSEGAEMVPPRAPQIY